MTYCCHLHSAILKQNGGSYMSINTVNTESPCVSNYRAMFSKHDTGVEHSCLMYSEFRVSYLGQKKGMVISYV